MDGVLSYVCGSYMSLLQLGLVLMGPLGVILPVAGTFDVSAIGVKALRASCSVLAVHPSLITGDLLSCLSLGVRILGELALGAGDERRDPDIVPTDPRGRYGPCLLAHDPEARIGLPALGCKRRSENTSITSYELQA